MHNEEAIKKEIEYNEIMQRRMIAKSIKARKAGDPHETFQMVSLEYGSKAAALKWVIEEGAFHRI
jgi:hypothetical protein